MLLLENAIRANCYILDLKASDYDTVLQEAVRFIQESLKGSIQDSDQLLEHMKGMDSAIGDAVAVPHAYLESVTKPIIVFIRLDRPLNLEAPDNIPVQFVLAMVGPREVAADHVDELTDIARLFSNKDFRYDVGKAKDGADILAAIESFYAQKLKQREVAAEEPPELTRTGKFCGGIIQDLRRRLPVYKNDVKDGLHPKVFSSVLFLFFACLAPAVTFGGFMGIFTNGAIGAVEMITATALCGVLYALFSGQPLIILGGTGPLLVLTMILYQLCQDMNMPFLPTYAWVGMWTAVFTIICAVTDLSFLMKYFTRFTDEIFAALIAVIFIYEAIRSIAQIFTDHKVSYDTALLSLLLAAGTFYIASELSSLRKSRFLYAKMREFLADFGPAIAICVMTVVAVLLREVELEVLPAPDAFATTSGRSWFVDPFEAPTWIWFAAAIPAIFVTVLVFLDQNITSRLVNSPDHRLKRGAAYHLDLAVVGGLVGICSLFGLPWLVAATVRSINHVRSLATIEEELGTESRGRILAVRENRVSGLMIHLLVGGALLFLPLIKTIPLAVLYGLFLYMGVVSMKGNQFFERLSLWPMDPQHYPVTHYLRRVPKKIIHKFTLIQLVALAVLWAVKTSKIGILFPIFIGALVPLRLYLNRKFPLHHLAVLDAEELPDEEEQRRVD